MHRQTRLFVFMFLIISIVAQRDKKKTCIHNLVINGTNLLTGHRKQLLVVGITNFNNRSAARMQANRYNDLYRELQHQNIRDSIARLILINEREAERNFPGNQYDKIRLYQDNSKDRLIAKLRNNGETKNNYVFGRCGYLLYSQEGSHADLENGGNYQELLRVITTAVKNKRRCQGLCS